MNWFRSNIKRGSRLALFALAVQFAFSFGHFHGAAAQAAPSIQSGLTEAASAYAQDLSASNAASEAAQKQQPSNHDTDQQRADDCAICAVIVLANNVLLAAPPLLLLPQAVELLYLATDTEFTHLSSVYPAFRSRGPPIS
jgi:hypothetical protein